MYDSVEKTNDSAKSVCKGSLRKYYRFRPARFYGGIATADCVGCNLSCIFCWSWSKVKKPDRFGQFYSSEEVARKLTSIARKKGLNQIRISGNEPTISRKHLLEVLDLIPRDIFFILETNGIMIGYDESFAEDLSLFKKLHVRVSIKGTTEEEFAKLTGAKGEGFSLQLKALEHLSQAGVNAHPAVMISFSPIENIKSLEKRLVKIAPQCKEIEIEELVLYGNIEKRLQKANLNFRTAYQPRYIPPNQV